MLGFNEITYSLNVPSVARDADYLSTWTRPEGPLGSVLMSYGCRRFDAKEKVSLFDARAFLGIFYNLGGDLRYSFGNRNLPSGTLRKNHYYFIDKQRGELQKELTAREQQLKANEENKALLDRSYGQTETRQKLSRDYESLQTLAKNFAGRSYDLDVPSDREAMKVNMLSSLRRPALKILEELAKAYHDQFDRPLPVSSLVRPEQYQRELRKVNRNAVLIDTPSGTSTAPGGNRIVDGNG